jgi:hypothetical protein
MLSGSAAEMGPANSSSPAVRDMWDVLTKTPAGAKISSLREKNPTRYLPRLTWGGYPPGFVKGPRPPGVSYDVRALVPGEDVSRQVFVANSGRGAAGTEPTGDGGVPVGDVISGTPRVAGSPGLALGYVKDVVSADTVGTPGNFTANENAAEYTVPVVSTALAGTSNAALSMPMIAALAIVGLFLVVGGGRG